MKSVITIFLILGLYACGGGGGSNVEFPDSTETIPISTNTLIQYRSGDWLEYQYTYRSAYYDGSGEIAIDGVMDTYALVPQHESPLLSGELAISRVVTQNGDVVGSTFGHYGYDENGGLRHYLVENGYYANQANFYAGTLILPGTLGVGMSWVSTGLFRHPQRSDYYNVTINYAITTKESIITSYGEIESYKVTYSASGDEWPLSTSFSGIMWVNPSLGIVSLSESGEFSSFAINQNYTVSWSLSDTNL